MNELSERIYELRTKTWSKIGFDTNSPDFTQRYDTLIAQALLAERKSVWELAIQRVRDHKWVAMELTPTMKTYSEAVADISEALRAAAEKETK